jgi:hypothetical protein
MRHRPPPNGDGSSGAWYVDPHGFGERAAGVRRRRRWYARVSQRLVPETTLWGWADVDGARALKEGASGLESASTGPAIAPLETPETLPELDQPTIHPQFTPE